MSAQYVSRRADVDAAIKLGLTAEEFAHICEIQGGEPTYVELAIYSLMWSEHCSYKHSRPVLGRFPTERAARPPGPRRERRHHRHRRRLGDRDEGREPQPPVGGRALPGRGDRRRRHRARHLHDGGAADRLVRLAALRRARRAAPALPARRRRRRHRPLRQLPRHPDRLRRDLLRAQLRGQLPRQRHGGRHPAPRPDRARQGGRHRQPRRAHRQQDRPRRHRRRQRARQPGVRRDPRGEAPVGPGRRPVHREEAHRGLPRSCSTTTWS